MPNLLSVIGGAWDFARKQPALFPAGFWFVLLPLFLSASLARLQEFVPFFQERTTESVTVIVLLSVLLGLLLTWGSACVLVISRRRLQAKAGRTRTSLRSVQAEARPLYLPLLLTGILRSIFTFFWMLLLIIPGIVYSIQTAFYPVIIVAEGTSYRAALRQSKDTVRGRFWSVFLSLLGLGLLLFLPVQLLGSLAETLAKGGPLPILFVADIFESTLLSVTVVLYLVSLTDLYGYFRAPSGPVSNVHIPSY